ncbi:MAG: hypothetical protein K8R92_07325 [Planctomycetes bacterium]|nr:hypothetical protein [Planctomycetota bacterium]
MKRFFAAVLMMAASITPAALARGDAPPMPDLNNPSGWPLVGYGLAFLLVGGAVYVSLYTGKRENLD